MVMSLAFILAAQADNSDEALRITLVTTLGVIVTGLLTYFSTRYAAKKSAATSTAANRVTERQVDVGEWKDLLEQVKGEAQRLDGRVQDLEAKDEAKRERIESLENTVSLNKIRISDLERAAADQAVKYAAAMQYIRDIMSWAVSFITNENKPPTPPPSIADDIKDDRLETS